MYIDRKNNDHEKYCLILNTRQCIAYCYPLQKCYTQYFTVFYLQYISLDLLNLF